MNINLGNWTNELHSDFEQVKRIDSARKLKKHIICLDTEKKYIEIQGSSKEPYVATLEKCTCPDFMFRRLPCKHMYCLAFELGLMEDLPVFDKKTSTFDAEAETKRFYTLYENGEISADTYAKIFTTLIKDFPSSPKTKKNFDISKEIAKYCSMYEAGQISSDTYVRICTALSKAN